MYPERVRYKTRRALMIEQQERNGPFIRASNKIMSKLTRLLRYVEEGKVLDGYFEEISEHYLIEISVNKEEITIRLRDTTIKNQQGKHYIVINMSYMYKTKKVNRQSIDFPFQSFWSPYPYKYDLSEWENGEKLISVVMNLGVHLRRPTAKLERGDESIEQSAKRESSVKENLIEKLEKYKLESKVVFANEPIRNSFQQLLDALSHVMDDYNRIDNIEDIHMFHRMISSEVQNLLTLYNKLNEIKQKQHETRYISVLNGMTEQVRVMLRKEEEYTEKELEKQFKLMENRYMEKQTHI